MRIIIDIETNEADNTSTRKKELNRNSEDKMLEIIKDSVEEIIERSHFVSDYFKNCKVTRE